VWDVEVKVHIFLASVQDGRENKYDAEDVMVKRKTLSSLPRIDFCSSGKRRTKDVIKSSN
jgi:hypothetical protein